ncbi:MAG: HigA family addiction module antidote protein [Deltaproteobacteria bacterium]|nr:HigA family addiction module antidote protein [Deltaproteobacteria bacterium]
MLPEKKPTAQPPHPGFVLKKEYIEPLGVSVTDLAAKLGVSRNTLSSIINERAGVSPDMALRLSKAFRTTPEMWLKLKTVHDLWEAEQLDSGWNEVEPIRPVRGQTQSTGSKHTSKRKRVPRG